MTNTNQSPFDSAVAKLSASLQVKQPPYLLADEVHALYVAVRNAMDKWVFVDHVDMSKPDQVEQFIKQHKEGNVSNKSHEAMKAIKDKLLNAVNKHFPPHLLPHEVEYLHKSIEDTILVPILDLSDHKSVQAYIKNSTKEPAPLG